MGRGSRAAGGCRRAKVGWVRRLSAQWLKLGLTIDIAMLAQAQNPFTKPNNYAMSALSLSLKTRLAVSLVPSRMITMYSPWNHGSSSLM
jgi:hypothetical protein